MTLESAAVISVMRLPGVFSLMERDMTVFIDDRRVGELSYFDRKEFITSPGEHTVLVEMDWRRSEKIRVEAPADGVVELQCGQSRHGFKAFLDYFFKRRSFYRVQAAPPREKSPGAKPGEVSETLRHLPLEKISTMYEHDPLFEENAARTLRDAFGNRLFGMLTLEEANQIDINGTDLCQKLLRTREAENNSDIAFILYVKMAKFALKENQYRKALAFYKKALEIFPDSPLVNFRIAEVFECVNAGEDAIRHYEAALINPSTNERIKPHISSQIDIVKTSGPRGANQFTGLRYMSY